jgi:signal transduction histidine kinase
VLFELDPADLAEAERAAEAERKAADSAFATAQADFQRLRDLQARGFVSEQALDRARLAMREAESRRDAAQAVRKIAAGLRPSILDDFGLWAAIECLAQDFQERTGIPCELSMDVPYVSVRRDRATAIFRILREALTNMARHAQASRVSITVQAPGNDLRLEVTDNGKGIPSERIHDPQSFGLRGMFERAAALGGEVRIHGTPGQGTRVAICLPLEETRGEKP